MIQINQFANFSNRNFCSNKSVDQLKEEEKKWKKMCLSNT